MMTRSAPRALTLAAAGVIVALTAAAFWLSYAHLQSVAAAHGLATSPARAWAWPATLDLFIVAGELLLLRASLTARTDWWAIGLTVTGSGGSIALNISGVGAHAHTLAYVVAAVPPTAALLAFGALMRQVHDALAAPTDAAADHADATTDSPPTTPAVTPLPASGGAGQPATAPDDTAAAASAPDSPAPALPAPAARDRRRARQTPGIGKTARPARTDAELLDALRALRMGASAPLSQRAAVAALGIGVPRLRALLETHGQSLDPLPLPEPRPLHLAPDTSGSSDRAAAAR